MAWAGLDHRVFPRVSTQCDLAISSRTGKAIKAKTENLGAGGACVILDQELEKLSRTHIRIVLEPGLPPIECEARVVWTVRSKEPASGKVSFDTGIEFLNLSSREQERIKTFVRSWV
jgi:c-di-GMP-binding flagellar brake protein YcgR